MDKQSRTTYHLADLTDRIRFEELPAEVVEKARLLVADSIACMIGGTLPVQGRKMIGIFGAMAGVPDVGICGTTHRMPLLNAVYVNSYLATTLDLDDTYDGHPGSTIVPVALSLGQINDISGRALIEAVVTGYEVGIRVANGIKPTPERTKLVRGINTWQIFCAAAVAAKLEGLDREKTAHAYGHAALHASVPSLRKWGFIDGKIQWLKNNFGYTAYGGVLSAILAREGFLADTTIFDGEDGFWIMASSDRCDYDAIRVSLEHYYTLKVHTKPYPACRHIHPTLDAVTAIARESRPSPSNIESVLVETFYEVVEDYTSMPTLPFDVVFSAPYLVALALHCIEPGPEWLVPERISDPALLATAGKVSFAEWEEASRLYPQVERELMSKVTVIEKSGQRHHRTVRIPKGDPRNPMTMDEIADKFDALTGPVIGLAKADRLFRLITEDLDSLEHIGELAALTTL
ncbi:MAG: MmgE/PrpD family protein [Desulfobacteraceae bacterium]|nr:MmgE/PrpD family protein [Desulfobacteraceae bacterium]MBC2751922.1 MmgE/PrpD family protein [Desulfobacteraceae bacterium]